MLEDFEIMCEDIQEYLGEKFSDFMEKMYDEDVIIKNVDNFVHKLSINNLLTDELEQFIEEYMRYENK